MNNREKIVITGASGFLGRNLVERLRDDERYMVHALSSRPDELKARIGGAYVEYLYKDVVTSEQASVILKDAIIINCAYPRNAEGTMVADGLRYIQSVFVSAVENHALAIINISSQSVYSQQRKEAATEETPVCPESLYAVGKYAVELMLESICKNSGTKFTNLRMASLIGPGFDQRIVNRFVKQALETGKLTVKKNQQKFGFFDVKDATEGLISIIGSCGRSWSPIYNFGQNLGYTLSEIAEAVCEVVLNATGKTVSLQEEDGTEYSYSIIDGSTFAEEFNYIPKVGLKSSIQLICQHLLSLHNDMDIWNK